MTVPERLQVLLEADSPLQRVAERLTGAGYQCYLVGGSVRDALLDRTAVDLDVSTEARPDAIEALVRGWADHVWLQGKRFGTIGLLKGLRRIEITTHRAEAYRPDSRRRTSRFSVMIWSSLSTVV